MTPLEDYLDQEFTAVIQRAREKFPQHPEEFHGKVTGFMLVTAIVIARKNGCPKKVLLNAVTGYVRKHYP